MGAVVWIELPEFDEDGAAFGGTWGVAGGWRVADVGAGREIAVFILEGAFEDEEFLAAAVGVGGEAAAGGVADDGGGAGDFAADPIEHAALHALDGRGDPGEPGRVHGGAGGEVGIQVHGAKAPRGLAQRVIAVQ